MDYFIGIDAGGTHSRASLYDNEGNSIGTGKAGGANVFSDFAAAMQQIDLAIDLAINASNIPIDKKALIVGAGCAGGQTNQAQLSLSTWDSPYKHVFMTSDLHASCAAANNGQDCVILITGTGSAIAHYQNAQVTQYGGHGFIHGDEASGAWLGLSAVQLLLKSNDNLIHDEQFCKAISHAIGFNNEKTFLGNEHNANVDYILNHFKSKLASDYAQLAPCIINLQRAGNSSANKLVSQGVDYLCSVLTLNSLHYGLPIFMTGGIAKSYQPLLEKKLGRAVQLMQRPAQDGAMLLAKSKLSEIVKTTNTR
ncbi:BadF/BadG/BcrA/BcrD ATPase family protein [Glaciecola sp. 33A]|jgi:glucosamine kinase|uniref:BadF/BadG/BcrA/BcrD ATPase family protein n=1 Tax=Glaciecola sp. 33A TaxID=2057807 RepID=UPI000C33C062|nr:BadF/BadG/BcrA/BcrD ATPase family protein [Glaciecola sp. 33A]PKI00728.1 ATPase [Glaciecola sp. 33A]